MLCNERKKKRKLTVYQRQQQELDRMNEVKSSSSSARAVSVESEFVPIVNEQNEGGNPQFRIGEKVAVGYLEVEGTTKVKAGELKWSKATIKSGPTMVTKKGKHVCYIITYHGSAHRSMHNRQNRSVYDIHNRRGES